MKPVTLHLICGTTLTWNASASLRSFKDDMCNKRDKKWRQSFKKVINYRIHRWWENAFQVSVEKCGDYLQRGENKGCLLSLWCLCPESGEWRCRMAGRGLGSEGPGKPSPGEAADQRHGVSGWPRRAIGFREEQCGNKETQGLEHKALGSMLVNVLFWGKEEHGERGKGLEGRRRRDRNKQDMEIYRTWDWKDTQMQAQSEEAKGTRAD